MYAAGWGCQAVVAQTAFSAVIGWDLIEHGQWKGVGVLGPEAFDPISVYGQDGRIRVPIRHQRDDQGSRA